jgi:hypothetical protein
MNTANVLGERIEHDLMQAGLGVAHAPVGGALLVPCRVLGQDAIVRVTPEGPDCSLQLTAPFFASPEQRAYAARAVCDLNWRLSRGSFLLDPESGQLSYVLVEPSAAPGVERPWLGLIASCVKTVEECLPRFLRRLEQLLLEQAEVGAARRGQRLSALGAAAFQRESQHGAPQVFVQDAATHVVRGLLLRHDLSSEWYLQPVLDGALVQEVAVAAEPWLSAQRSALDVVLSSEVRERELEQEIERLGCCRRRIELVVERDLSGRLPAVEAPLVATRPDAYPERLVDRVLEGTAGLGLDGFSGAALRRDGAAWVVWRLAGEPLGVSVWAPIEEQRLGVVDFIGLLPEQRGRGLGAAIHAATLRELAASGLTRYRDATHADNLAMQRVFFKHGCQLTGFLVYFEPGSQRTRRNET